MMNQIFCIHVFLVCWIGVILGYTAAGVDSAGDPSQTNASALAFQFSKPHDCNELGIKTKIMLQIEKKANLKPELWRINPDYTTAEMREGFKELCDKQIYTKYSEAEGDDLQWGNCTFSPTQITTVMTQGGTPEMWDKTISFMDIGVEPFRNPEGGKCVLNLFPQKRFYVVFLTLKFGAEEDSSVYKLDKFFPQALEFFSNVIDVESMYQFEPMDFINQTQRYRCLLSILRPGVSAQVIRSKCLFDCRGLGRTEL